ncbi:MAG: complement resistance protein TraT [Desulfarculaceae bacterium]|nr:complement resistance protein TraT [Desulfarculaceae bacterium]MCF8073674.1 complement resistance protein TraT [Desulfarculaceae bacterium]MCF8101915.1 complement resistance protein TraT [Desulfarculaceae bacterium]MCF8117662.1 complement resistance protein TraT [Desulfarculaceae bacterium]
MTGRKSKLMLLIAGLATLALLSGCAATYTGIRYADLKVENKMSASIFLDPVAPAQRTVFVQVRNTSDMAFNLQSDIVGALTAKGFKVVDDPNQAHFWLQANVLSVGLTDESALEKAKVAGFGGPIAGGAIGAVLGGSQAGAGAAIGAVAGGAAELISGAMVKVNTYAVVTDLQLSERSAAPTSQRFDSSLKQGTGQTRISQQSASTSSMKKYQTRIISTARKTNLEWPEAYPALRQGIAQAIAGVM